MDAPAQVQHLIEVVVVHAVGGEGVGAPLEGDGLVGTHALVVHPGMQELTPEFEARQGLLACARQGLARELARMSLNLNFYTQWYWKIDLHNLLHFLSLRADPHAQYEIRVYAEAMLEAVKRWVPLCYEAFLQYRLHAVSFSQNALLLLRRMLNGESVSQEESGLSRREWREVMTTLGLEPE